MPRNDRTASLPAPVPNGETGDSVTVVRTRGKIVAPLANRSRYGEPPSVSAPFADTSPRLRSIHPATVDHEEWTSFTSPDHDSTSPLSGSASPRSSTRWPVTTAQVRGKK